MPGYAHEMIRRECPIQRAQRDTKKRRQTSKIKKKGHYLDCTYTTPSPHVAPVDEVGMRKRWRVVEGFV